MAAPLRPDSPNVAQARALAPDNTGSDSVTAVALDAVELMAGASDAQVLACRATVIKEAREKAEPPPWYEFSAMMVAAAMCIQENDAENAPFFLGLAQQSIEGYFQSLAENATDNASQKWITTHIGKLKQGQERQALDKWLTHPHSASAPTLKQLTQILELFGDKQYREMVKYLNEQSIVGLSWFILVDVIKNLISVSFDATYTEAGQFTRPEELYDSNVLLDPLLGLHVYKTIYLRAVDLGDEAMAAEVELQCKPIVDAVD